MSDDRTQPAGREGRLDEAVAAYFQAAEAGRAPDRREWLARYPDVAAELEHFFAGNERLDRLAAPFRLLAPAVSGLTDGDGAGGLGRLGDFQLLREVGRGGMGVVYEAEQISLGRRVALKILSFAATMDPRHLQRFENEARAAASLHHPNIVPVYAVGCNRGLRFYAMQLVDGQTLTELISAQRQERPSPSPTQSHKPASVAPSLPAAKTTPKAQEATSKAPPDAAYYRRVAEWGVQAAEALEHAHALGIIHRDVKPGNLMIDGGGKLWVTDFGLARVAADAGLTMTGDVLGTLRYMSPEQALAKHGLVDHRTDVYSLGATLYELATFEPAVSGKDRGEIFRRITLEDPTPPCALDRTVPAELEIIVLKAMAKEPQERYATAQELADDLRRWLEDRAIQARRPSLYQRLRKWGRRQRAAVTAAAVCLLVTFAAVAGSAGWVLGDRRARRAETGIVVEAALEEAGEWLRKDRPYEALSAALRADSLLRQAGGDLALQPRVDEMLWDVRLLLRLEQARLSHSAVRDGQFDAKAADEDYERAFTEFGLDVLAANNAEAAERIQHRQIGPELAAFLSHWAVARRAARGVMDPSWRTLLQRARLADPDEGWARAREVSAIQDWKRLSELAKSGGLDGLDATALPMLAPVLLTGAPPQVVALLRRTQQKRPADFWVNHDLALALRQQQPPQVDEAIGFYRAALALRPQSPGIHINLGGALHKKGKLDEAITAYREAIRLKPDYAEAHSNLGAALAEQGKADEAVAAFKDAIRLKPDDAEVHDNLGNVLAELGKVDEALVAYKDAIRLKHDNADFHNNLGNVLAGQGKVDEAITAYSRAIAIDPKYAPAHNGLGKALKAKGKVDEAIIAYSRAIAIDPKNAMAHNNLGNALAAKGKMDEAVAAYKEAIRLQPDLVLAHYCLGTVLEAHGKLDEAVAALKEAIRLKPEYAEAHCNLGRALQRQGRFAESLAAFRRGHELGSKQPRWPYPSFQWVWEAERRVELDRKLPAVLKGEVRPAEAAEAALLAGLCLVFKHRPAAAERLYREAFAAEPKLAENLGAGHRYNAACAAALAGCGQGKDAGNLDDKERARLRQQALEWLRADLTAWRYLRNKGPEKERLVLVQQLRHWRQDGDPAGVRDEGPLARLPAAERHAWQQLWADVGNALP